MFCPIHGSKCKIILNPKQLTIHRLILIKVVYLPWQIDASVRIDHPCPNHHVYGKTIRF
jgi:hypothetical protein